MTVANETNMVADKDQWCLIDDQSGFVLATADIRRDIELLASSEKFDQTKTDIGYGRPDYMGAFTEASRSQPAPAQGDLLGEPDDLFASHNNPETKQAPKRSFSL